MSTPRKFRVWDGEEMHEPPSKFWVVANGRASKEHHRFGMASEDHEQYEVMFSTGLTDAEGTEVYQGDILEGWGRRAKVEWDGYHARWDAGVAPECTGDFVGNAIVIGNCYENPELLEEPTS